MSERRFAPACGDAPPKISSGGPASFEQPCPSRFYRGVRISIAGLGDVGSTMATALASRPIVESGIESITLYDRDPARTGRWVQELSAIQSPSRESHPSVDSAVDEAALFASSDIFVFAVSAGVPAPGDDSDVRMRQFEANAPIVDHYARVAAESGFGGVFAVVSDPVEHLCASAARVLGRGAATRVIGLGLGVMFARAAVMARRLWGAGAAESFRRDGLVYGSHGKILCVLTGPDPARGFDPERSRRLSAEVPFMNLETRRIGFKPFVAPAVSSAALPLMAVARTMAGFDIPTGAQGPSVFHGSIADAGIFFGGPVVWTPEGFINVDFGLCPEAARMAAEARDELREDFSARGLISAE